MKFYAIGGFSEVGKNMCAVEIEGEFVIFDMGVYMDKIIQLEDEDERNAPTKDLIRMGALPDDTILADKKVLAIVLAHGHLDHIAAVPRLAEKYNCPIIGTDYTLEVVKKILRDEKKKELEKSLYVLNAGKTAKLSKNLQVEMVHITHSIPGSCLIALHTPEGIVTYLNDYKLDNNPTLGDKPNYKRYRELAKKGIKLHISECVRVEEEARTPPEYVAKVLVQDAIDRAYEDPSLVVITTFSSHIARLRTILAANKGRRKVLFCGRSLSEYIKIAEKLGLMKLDGAEVFGRRKTIERAFDSIVSKNPSNYLVVCTGNQGEPNAVLSRIARKEFKFAFEKEDQVIFSSEVIPSPINKANRFTLERDLREQGVRIMDHVHVSGHARREDHRDMIRMLKPQNIIPSHGHMEKLSSFAALATEEGYFLGKNLHILYDGAVMEIK